MRIGKNPYKSKSESNKAYQHKEVLAAVVTYIPYQHGYYKDRFELLKICLKSLIINSPEENCEILVFDQGSDPEVCEYLIDLKNKSKIDFLFLSDHNLGYNGALNQIYSIAEDRILSFSDDDVFYHPNWLENQLQILQSFPDVGVVSGFPTKTKFKEHNKAAENLVDKYPIEQESVEWNWDWEKIFVQSVGASLSQFDHIKEYDVKMYKYNGVDAFPVNTHFQYLIIPEARAIVYPFKTGYNMSSISDDSQLNMRHAFDEKLDEAGIVKLSTIAPYTEHMGNILTDRIIEMADNLDEEENRKVKSSNSKMLNLSLMDKILISMMRSSFFAKSIKYLHGRTFELINKKKQAEKGN